MILFSSFLFIFRQEQMYYRVVKSHKVVLADFDAVVRLEGNVAGGPLVWTIPFMVPEVSVSFSRHISLSTKILNS